MTEGPIERAKKKDYVAFMCRCGEESKAKSQALVDGVIEELRSKNNPDEITTGNLVSRCVYRMANLYGGHVYARIIGIDSDQWAAVSAEALLRNKHADKFAPDFHTYIECDQIEDGIAATYRAMVDHYKDHVFEE